MKTLFLTILLLLLFPLPSWGADGDECIVHSGTLTKITKGIWREIACVQLCDGKDAADDTGAIGDCTEFNFSTVVGTPDLIVFEYEELPAGAACSATPAFTITTGPVAGGIPSYDLDSTAISVGETTNRVVVDVSTAPPDNFLFVAFDVGTGADCVADAVDVRMHLLTRDMF